jgi:hypothetical protein
MPIASGISIKYKYIDKYKSDFNYQIRKNYQKSTTIEISINGKTVGEHGTI